MKLSKLILHYHITFYLFLLVVVSISVSRNIFIISLWPWILSWILEGNFKEKFNKRIFHREFLPFWSILMLFAFYSLSLLWSENKSYGVRNISEMVTLVIVPFFMVFSSDRLSDPKNLKLILQAYLSGLLISSFYLIVIALTRSLAFNNWKISFHPMINDWESVFFNNNFTYLIHPSYYAMMLIMAISFCLNDIQKGFLFGRKTIIPIILSIYFTIIVFLTQSRAAFIALFVIAIYFLFNYKIRISVKVLILSVIILASLAYLGTAFRFRALRENLVLTSEPDGSTISNFNIRYRIWKSAMIIIKSNPVFGVGLGDEQNEMNKIYKENNYSNAYEKQLNCHNQFLQTWLSTGIIGLLILLYSLVSPLISSELWEKSYYLSFVLIVVVMFLFESMFERVWGVAFFSIFYSLLTTEYNPNHVTDIRNNLTEQNSRMS